MNRAPGETNGREHKDSFEALEGAAVDLRQRLLPQQHRRVVSLRFTLLSALVVVVFTAMVLISLSALRLFWQSNTQAGLDQARQLALVARTPLTLSQREATLEDWREGGLIANHWVLIRSGLDSPWRHDSLELEPGYRCEIQPRAWLESGHARVNILLDEERCVMLEMPPTRRSERLASAQITLLLHMLLVALLVLILGFLLLTRSVVRPIQRLLHASERVAEGDLNTRIAVGGVGELAALSGTFNAMVAAEKDAREALHEKVVVLEQTYRDLQRSKEALESAHEQLVRSEKLASVGQLAAGVAHEIGNPLASLQAYLEMLGEDDLSEAERRDFLRAGGDAARRIQTIIRELLRYSRDEEPELMSSSPIRAIEQALRLLEPQPRMRQVELILAIEEGLPEVCIDENKVVQILLNLLLNAADALDGSGQIELGACAIDEDVVIWVQDTGPGIPDAITSKLFEPFFTTKAPGSGTGLGLAVCDRLAQQMSASLKFVPSQQGARFELRLVRALARE